MDSQQTLSDLISSVSSGNGSGVLDEDLPLVEQEWDSLDVATLLIEVERQFQVVIATEVLGELRTIRDIKNFLKQNGKIEAQAAQ